MTVNTFGPTFIKDGLIHITLQVTSHPSNKMISNKKTIHQRCVFASRNSSLFKQNLASQIKQSETKYGDNVAETIYDTCIQSLRSRVQSEIYQDAPAAIWSRVPTQKSLA